LIAARPVVNIPKDSIIKREAGRVYRRMFFEYIRERIKVFFGLEKEELEAV